MGTKEISEIATHELVNELKKREGVRTVWVEPEIESKETISSPILVLIVTD